MAFTQFVNIIRHTFDECCPNEKIKINYKNRHVWINKNMKSDIEKREKLFKLKLKEPTEEKIAIYKSFRNIVMLDSEKLKGNILVNSIEQALRRGVHPKN